MSGAQDEATDLLNQDGCAVEIGWQSPEFKSLELSWAPVSQRLLKSNEHSLPGTCCGWLTLRTLLLGPYFTRHPGGSFCSVLLLKPRLALNSLCS